MHLAPSAYAPCVGLQSGLSVVYSIVKQPSACPTTKIQPRQSSPATSHQENSTVGPILRSKSAKRPSAHRVLRVFCWSGLLPSMKHIASQLFLIKSQMSSFSVMLASLNPTFSLFIKFLFLDLYFTIICPYYHGNQDA